MFICMRTTLNLDDALMRTLKRRAAESGRTLTDMIEEAIREMLGRPERAKPECEFLWVTARGRVRPGVDVADRDSLLEAMEGRD
jgi:predicted transcriptional regulator